MGMVRDHVSIAAICWRLLASATVADLMTWIQSWAEDSLCGGLPDRRADEIHIGLFRVFHKLGNQKHATAPALKQDHQKCGHANAFQAPSSKAAWN